MEWPEHTVSIENYKCMKHCSGVTPEGRETTWEMYFCNIE